MSYFEKVYLGRKEGSVSKNENKRLQKALCARALKRSIDSQSLTTADYKRMLQKTKLNPGTINNANYENFINPFDI